MSFPFSAVLFDLDGTLVDSASDITTAVNRMLAEEGLEPVDEALVRSWIGDGTAVLLDTALQHAGSTRSAAELLPRFMEHYGDSLLLGPRVYPGVAETLAELERRGVPMAVCTNKPEPFVAPLLEHLGLDDYFDAVVAAGTLPERKPHPRPLLHLAGQLQAPPHACLMVGDSETDYLAARAAGMPVVLVSWGYARSFNLREADALAVIDRAGDLLDLPVPTSP